MTKRIVLAFFVLTIITSAGLVTPAQAQGCEYWVAPAPEGSNNNPGTSAQPWATPDYASARVFALGGNNCLIWFKDGAYTGSFSLEERFSSPVTFKAINPYKAVLQNDNVTLELSGAKNMIFEGFEFRHSSPNAGPIVVYVARSGNDWTEYITFRNNIFHDSYNNDLLKILDGARFITVENNIFYNQGDGEQQMDVNSVTDITIQDNIFFNDFAGSGRINTNNTKHFIVIKDSNDNTDGLMGSERTIVRRNIFLNWEGGIEAFVQVGNDGKPYYEAKDVRIENNLMIGNSPNEIGAAFGVSGAKNVTFANNTVVGDLPSSAYAFRIVTKGSNPQNQNIYFYNNIWSDPTGTMGNGQFSSGNPSQTNNIILDNNLYWNRGAAIPSGDLISPLVADHRRIVADPGLTTNQNSIILPRWNGSTFPSGNTSIRQEFERLVSGFAQLSSGSQAIDKADITLAPNDDILGHWRGPTAEMGAYEYNWTVAPTFSDVIYSHWAWSWIERLYNAGITGGCSSNPLRYCPETSITRAQMAVFLERGIHGSNYTPPAVGASTGFNDVLANYWSAAWIKQLAADGITSGCGSGNYCPDNAVTRAQMAVFLLKAKHGSSYSPPAVGSSTSFNDVPTNYWAAAWIKQLAAEGVTGGCGAGIYCPDSPVTRAQMAVFMVRAFSLP